MRSFTIRQRLTLLLTCSIRSRRWWSALWADDAPFRPVMGKRGAGAVAMDAGSSACGVTTVAASASVTPRRCARAVRERAGASAEGAEGRKQDRQEDVDPLMRFALAHAKQASLEHLERVGLQVGQDEEQPIFWRREGTVFIHAKLASGPGFPIEAPRRHMGLEGGLKGQHQLLQLV